MEAIKDMKLERSGQGGRRVRVVAGHGTLSVDLGAEEIVALLGQLAVDAIGAGEPLMPTDFSDVSMGGRHMTVAQLTEAYAFASTSVNHRLVDLVTRRDELAARLLDTRVRLAEEYPDVGAECTQATAEAWLRAKEG